MGIDARRTSINSREQEQEEDEAGLGLNPHHGFDHLNSDNAQHSLRHSLSQDSFQYPLQQPSRGEDESRTLYPYHHQHQISPILRSSSDMDYSTSNASNTITNLLLNIPEIVVTEAEPQIKSPTTASSSDTIPYAQQNVYYPNPTSPNSLYDHHHDGNFRGGEEEGSPDTENVPYGINSRGIGQGYGATPLISAGYGSFPSMVFRMHF